MHCYTQTVIIKLFTLALTLIFATSHSPPPTHTPIPSISPPYEKLIRDYKIVDSKNIQKALDSVNWERLFDQKDINVEVI